MILIFLCLVLPFSQAIESLLYVIGQAGTEFLPSNSVQLLSNTSASNPLMCAIACNKEIACRTLDYDSLSYRCRLYEADLTTGSVIPSTLSNSIVMAVAFSSNLYTSTHNQPCQACADSRYEQCINNICQCPPHTYWNGNQCLLQLFENQKCVNIQGCRKDLNLTCLPCDQDTFTTCAVMTLPVCTTIAGSCNGTAGSSDDMLNLPRGLAIINNGTTLFVAEEGNARVQKFSLLTKTNGSTIMIPSDAGAYPSFLRYFNNSLYIGIPPGNKVSIWPTNATLPTSPPFDESCSTPYLYGTAGISLDSDGSIYVPSQMCHWIIRWTRSNSTGIAGIAGVSGSNSQALSYPAGTDIDQNNSLYVADYNNNRIQKFMFNGNGVGITVAGGNGAGTAANQLSYPLDVCISRLTGDIYIADFGNNRIQRWSINATQGVTVAGDPSGSSGVTPMLLNRPFAVALDPINETFLYVSDYNNNRVLRFSLI